MEEYYLRIEHIVDGKKVGTDYVMLTKDEYIKVMHVIVDDD